MNVREILQHLESLANHENVAGMERFGIRPKRAFGVAAPELKQFAREIKKRAEDKHALALELWETGIQEARIIAYLIDDARKVTEAQMEGWAKDFDNWAICDSCCGHLFDKTPFAYRKAFEWAEREEEFVKRAGIVLMAWLAVHDKKADDAKIEQFLPVLEKHSLDERNFVKKGVSWALRQIGKRSVYLNEKTVEAAQRIEKKAAKSARWIASDVLRELKSEKVWEKLQKKVTK